MSSKEAYFLLFRTLTTAASRRMLLSCSIALVNLLLSWRWIAKSIFSGTSALQSISYTPSFITISFDNWINDSSRCFSAFIYCCSSSTVFPLPARLKRRQLWTKLQRIITYLCLNFMAISKVLERGRSINFFLGFISVYWLSNYFHRLSKEEGSFRLMTSSSLNLLSQRWKERTLGLKSWFETMVF